MQQGSRVFWGALCLAGSRGQDQQECSLPPHSQDHHQDPPQCHQGEPCSLTSLCVSFSSPSRCGVLEIKLACYKHTLFSLSSYTHTHTHAQWPSTHGGVFECNESPSVLIDLMNKVYVTHPDLLLLCCQLLAQCPTQHRSIQVSSLYRRKEEEGGGEEGRVMMTNLRTDYCFFLPSRGVQRLVRAT